MVRGGWRSSRGRLLDELRAAAEEDGFRVLTARGSELEREFPFGVVRQLFEPALSDEEVRDRWLVEVSSQRIERARALAALAAFAEAAELEES